MSTITKLKGKVPGWRARVRKNGISVSQNFGTKLEAQRWAALTEAAATQRPLAIAAKATMGDLLREFKPHAAPSAKPLLCYWERELGRLHLNKIPPALIAQHRDRLLDAEWLAQYFDDAEVHALRKNLKPITPPTRDVLGTL